MAMEDEKRLPRHIGFIMDGNGRWAKERRRPRTYGHSKAVGNVTEIVEYCFKRGIEVVSLFAFSTENWKRPKEEVETLFGLIKKYFTKHIKKILKEGVRLEVMGDLSKLPPDIQEDIKKSVDSTKDNDKRVLNIGINYGGRSEIVSAVNKLIASGAENVTEEAFERELYTHRLPDPDIVVRTSGEMRISNFMLYQMAYSELYFTDKFWPDFHKEDVEDVLEEYANRQRRFGAVTRG